MAQEKMLSGCAAAAQGAKFAEVEVICSFPIRPYTAIMMELSRMVANGELDAEFLHGEGEHAQVSVVLGASACGARAYTGSSGVGVTYAFEVYSPAAGGRYPLQMAIADRTLDPPGDFGSEHTDAMSARDQGWLMGWAATPQEVFDNTLINYRVGEDPRIMLPQFVCQDGYFLSHIPDKVILPEMSQVREFLPPYKAPHPLSPRLPGFTWSPDPARPGSAHGCSEGSDLSGGAQGDQGGDRMTSIASSVANMTPSLKNIRWRMPICLLHSGGSCQHLQVSHQSSPKTGTEDWDGQADDGFGPGPPSRNCGGPL